MIGEENNMSILERPGDTGNGELDLETWSDHETLVGEEDPGEGSSSDGNQPCLRPEVRTDLATGVNPEIQTKPRPQRKESPTQNAKIELLHSEPLIANDKSLESLIVNDRSPDHRWILNCTLRSGNGPDHEKFIVTYIQLPNQSYRVTVSCDYRNAEPDSLEAKLKETQYQDDKGRDIYDSIRTSLPDIHFYDTVTSLRLETIQNRLHIHVTEDVDEAIPYPPRMAVAHVLSNSPTPPMEVTESELEFDCHLAGFVYGVSHGGKEYVKKEIPGPDAVDEFLYEVNALNDLNGSKYVIRLEAIVVDDSRQFVKGLLISRAQQGALVDLLYNRKGKILWEDRMRWAQQIVRGLSHIHKGGYVQGDFTLSNIVVDHNSDAWIIDINRRGCPVGWEPPEFAKKIESDQRISMHIGEKSDIYQAGMTLWALAMGIDEPETHGVPLSVNSFPEGVPVWYRSLVSSCLAPRPQDRPSATELVDLFLPSPSQATNTTMPTLESRKCLSGYPSLDFLTSLKSDCSEPSSVAENAVLVDYLSRIVVGMENDAQSFKTKLNSLNKARVEVENNLERFEERIKLHKERISEITNADEIVGGETNKVTR